MPQLTPIAAAVGTTQAEAEVLAATAAAIAAGKDPFGDDDDADDAAASSADNDDTVADDDTGTSDDDTGTGDDDTGQADDDDQQSAAAALSPNEQGADRQAPEVPLFKAQSPAEFKTQRDELLAKRAKAFKDYSDGVIEPEEYSRIDAEVLDALEQLTVQRTLHTANSQRAENAWDSALDAVMATAKTPEGGSIDYSADEAAAKQFDMATTMLRADGKQRTAAQLANDAHKAVLALRGIAAPTPKAGDGAAKPRTNGKPPVTLRGVPAAEVPNAGGGWMEQLSKLSGQEYEAAFARLTPAQQAQVRGD